MNGLHIIANLKNCVFDFAEEAILLNFCKIACIEHGLTVVGESSYIFQPQGFTFSILLAESHLCMHTWPENNAVALDIYTCNHSCDNNEKTKAIFNDITRLLQPQIIEVQYLNRETLK